MRRSNGVIAVGVLGAALLVAAAPPARAETLTVDRLVASPSLSGPQPGAVHFSPDGRWVSYLKPSAADASRRDLWGYELATGRQTLLVDAGEFAAAAESEEERARRERQRIRETGVTEYAWDEAGKAIVLPKSGDIYLKELAGPIRRLTRTPEAETDPKVSPDGRRIAYVRGGNLYVLDLAGGAETALTTDGADGILNGMAEFVAQEEMDRDTGYWWSPDGSRIAYAKVDERAVPLVNRYDYGADGVKVVPQRYPFAGGPNAVVRLYVQALAGGPPVAVDLGPSDDIYLARVNWRPDGGLAVQRLSRDHKRLDLLFADPATGASRVVLSDTGKTWVDLHSDLRFLPDGRFVWSSAADGFRHLFLHGADGRRLKAITRGDWDADAVVGLDAEVGTVLFTGFADGPLERHVYAAALDGSEAAKPRRLSGLAGWHAAELAKTGGAWLDTASAPDQPPQLSLRDRQGRLIGWLEENRIAEGHPYQPYADAHIAPTFGTLPAADGSRLSWMMLKPPSATPQTPAPAIVVTYGGPGVPQLAARRWSGTALLMQVMAQQGYVVFVLDNRGTANRGKAFEDQIYKAFGTVEPADQAAGAAYLRSLPFVRGDRIGIYGHSYGGYNTLMALLQKPEMFAAGVAGAPVTDWTLYDTFYTERFMGLPSEDGGAAYARASVLEQADRLERPLLLLHGMADDNVFLDNTVRLAARLQKARKPFEMMLYPGERHGFFDPDMRAHSYRTMLDFFDRHLKGG
ncbi:DPP IV N-terminal domain-containing protein [Rhodocista pekingensis]|uniref:DPP IV N-terminal domain-containing protein n=1 Tax=Rhodocista pekingensis TaxID=201185 RepID=A0ABW2L1E6_9PROT